MHRYEQLKRYKSKVALFIEKRIEEKPKTVYALTESNDGGDY